MVPGEGIEPPTNGLQNRCSTAELARLVGVLAESGDFLLRFCSAFGASLNVLPGGLYPELVSAA